MRCAFPPYGARNSQPLADLSLVPKLRLGTRFGAKLQLCLEGLNRINLSEAKQSLAPIGVPKRSLGTRGKIVILSEAKNLVFSTR